MKIQLTYLFFKINETFEDDYTHIHVGTHIHYIQPLPQRLDVRDHSMYCKRNLIFCSHITIVS